MKVLLLFSNKWNTKMMQSFDLFEPSKVVIEKGIAEIETDTWTEADTLKIVERCKSQPYQLVACFDKEKVYYKDPKVKSVSTGKQWCLLDDYLKHIQVVDL